MVNYILEIESENNEIKEYEFHSEELGSLNGVQDEILIENGELSIIKKIGITKEFLFYVLETPVKTKIDLEESIELFEGSNTLKIKDLNGNYIITYLLVNDSVDMLATKKEVASTIALLDNQITLKVDKEDVISQINQSSEKVTINSNKIKLEGHTTINDGFSIDPLGNMSCRDANINNLINQSGIYTGLVFHHKKEVLNTKGASLKSYIGYKAIWNSSYTNATLVRVPLYINYTIPDKFVATNAYIIVEFQSVAWGRAGGPAGSAPIGVVSDIGLYVKASVENSTSIDAFSMYDTTKTPHYFIGSRVDNVWGNGVHNYTFPSGLRRKKTENISSTLNNIKSGILSFAPQATTMPFDPNEHYGYGERKYSGYMSATLYVFGYLNKE